MEKHYGSGDGRGRRILNPVTEVYMEEGSSMEMEMEQIKGVDSTERTTVAELKGDARLVVKERLMTHGSQHAVSDYRVSLNGAGATADVVSRSVARDDSSQTFNARITGNAPCSGHTECDSIIMDNGPASSADSRPFYLIIPFHSRLQLTTVACCVMISLLELQL